MTFCCVSLCPLSRAYTHYYQYTNTPQLPIPANPWKYFTKRISPFVRIGGLFTRNEGSACGTFKNTFSDLIAEHSVYVLEINHKPTHTLQRSKWWTLSYAHKKCIHTTALNWLPRLHYAAGFYLYTFLLVNKWEINKKFVKTTTRLI